MEPQKPMAHNIIQFMHRSQRYFIAASLTALLAVPAISLLAKGPSHDEAVNRNLTVFNALVKELENSYVDSIKTDEAFEIAIGAMLMTVDPYTEYMTDEGQENLQTATTGEYGGIGSYIMERDGWVLISEPYEGSPAAEAGLRAGDRIVRIDTALMKGRKSSEVSSRLRGVPGSVVEVEVQRPYVADSLLTFSIERRKLSLPSVQYAGMAAPGIGYIQLSSFMEKSPEEVRQSIDELKTQGMDRGLILDLRGNGGGLLESAVDILSNFLPKGTEVLRTRGKDLSKEKIYKTQRSPLLPDMPLVVLIDGGSASSSEITAGAVQDLDRGVLVGSRSFGKGLVQSTRPLPYNGLLKVTIAKYYTPSGRLIQALDYSHRDADGNVMRTPDSLTNVYHTLAGREVRDGGGLTPDVTVQWNPVNNFIYRLGLDNRFFDFANRYAAEHESIAPAAEFAVSEEDFLRFKESVDTTTLKYDPESKVVLDRLKEAAKRDGYLDDETQEQLDKLAEMLTHDIDYDLDRNREEIERNLNREIVQRYYFTKGRIQQDMKADPGLDKAIEILRDPEAYKALLRP